MRWLNDAHGIQPDGQLKQIVSERRRIRAILASIPSNNATAPVLLAYCEHLGGADRDTLSSLRSTRMALRPAADLLMEAEPSMGIGLPTQKYLDQYVRRHPGQRAAVTGFVHFLKRKHGCQLELHHDRSRDQSARREACAKALMHLSMSELTSEQGRLRWIQLGLEYFHRVKVTHAQVLTAGIRSVDGRDDGWEVTLNDRVYWLPAGKARWEN